MAGTSIQAGSMLAAAAQTRPVRDALQWFTREKQWITELQLQLCRIAAPTFLEQQRAEWMAGQLRTCGCEVQIDRAGNVIAAPFGLSGGPFVAVTAHLDTVLAPRHKDDIYVDSEGKLRGPGVSDNGAGLAALLALARALQSAGAPEDCSADVLLVANVGEEGEGNLSGMRYLCRQSDLAPSIRAFIVLDGAQTDHITIQGLGSRRFDLTFAGPGGHSWSDAGAGNPVHALARAVSLFSDTRLCASPRCSINVGVMEGGLSINSIPSEAHAKIDIRSESNEKIADIVENLRDAVERAQEIENQRATVGRVTSKLREIGSRPAARLGEDAAILRNIRAVDSYLGVRAQLECSSTDANVPLALGLPAVSIGAGGSGGGAHTAQEWFGPEGRDLGLKRIFLTLCLEMQSTSAVPSELS